MPSFLSPLFLAGAAAAAVPIVLHLLRREPEPRLKFPAVKLLKQAPVERTRKRRLRELILLALRVATLLLLALAFARPYFASGAALGSSGMTIVALDISFSMSAPGRFARAQSLAKEAIRRAAGIDSVGVLTFADRAEIVTQPSGDRELALAAVDRVEPGFGGTRYRAGLNAAAQALDGRRGTIVVVTDLQEAGWDAGDRATVPDTATVEVKDVGAVPANVAVTAVRVAGERVAATLRNDGAGREVRVRLALDGRSAGEVSASLPADGSVEVPLAPRGRAATAAVSVDDPSGLQADNTRFAVFDGSGRPRLLLVTSNGDPARDAFYVNRALGAAGAAGASFDVEIVSAAQLSAYDQAKLERDAAVLVVSTRGLERRGRESLARYVERGGGILVAAGPDVDGEVASDLLGNAAPLQIAGDPTATMRALAPADVRHPVFQAFDAGAPALGLVRFRTVARIGGRDCQTLARFTTSEPALIECASGEGRGLVFASDLDNRWNDFPLHPTFVAFAQEAVRYLSSARPRSADLVVGAEGAPAAPGIVRLPQDGVERPVAVNVDPRESDPARMSIDEFQAAVTRLKAAGEADARMEASQQEERQHLWQYVLVLMVLALGIEGMIASRTA